MKKLTTTECRNRIKNTYKNEWDLVGEYTDIYSPIQVRHIKCNSIISKRADSVLYGKKCSCPVCDNNFGGLVIKGYNDLATVNPDFVQFLKNKDDAYIYSNNSNKKIELICPICKYMFKQICNQAVNRGLCCPKCNDNISYPEKFMFNLLKQADIDFKRQFSPSWAKPFLYDFMFDFESNKYIVEMDGQFHFNNKFSNFNRQQLNDGIKNSLAIDNGYYIIRIDCNYQDVKNRYSYILENILSSELSRIIDFSKIDFQQCDNSAQNSLVKTISDYWNQGVKNNYEIAKLLKMDRHTIIRYLKKASECNLIDESYEDIKKSNRIYSSKLVGVANGQKIKCNETGEIFNSYQEAKRKYGCDVYNFFKKHCSYCGKLPDGTKLTWMKI